MPPFFIFTWVALVLPLEATTPSAFLPSRKTASGHFLHAVFGHVHAFFHGGLAHRGRRSAFFLSHHCHKTGIHFGSHITTLFKSLAFVGVTEILSHGLRDSYFLGERWVVGHRFHEFMLTLALAWHHFPA